MILAGTLHAAVSPTDSAIAALRRNISALAVRTEILGLTLDQVWARFYVRGTSHEYAAPADFDAYLRVLNSIRGPHGATARDAFLRGWVEHRTTTDPPPPVVWHRFIGHTAIQVHPAAQR